MNRLRTRLIAAFVAATLLPLGLTLWITLGLLDLNLELAPMKELKQGTQLLELTGRQLYQDARETLRRDVAERRVEATPAADDVLTAGEEEAFTLEGDGGAELHYYVRRDGKILGYKRDLHVPMKQLTEQIGGARRALELTADRDVHAGFSRTLIVVAAALWVMALAGMMFLAERISRPIRQLTQGLGRVAAGDLNTRVPLHKTGGGHDEIGEALVAFNDMAAQSEHARERLIQVTRVASWQALARKMAHEVKNSLTPIRLTVEEMVSRNGTQDAFMQQAAQIVTEEVTGLEKRVRAFSEFAAEPPVDPEEIDVNAMVEERVGFLKAAHAGVHYEVALDDERPRAMADRDLVKGVLTNLLENAAQAAGLGGQVLARTSAGDGSLRIDVEDSGPGLSAQAKSSLFEPTISFKKGGMGLGLSIARRSALLCGGDLETFEGELGGAGFRLTLPLVTNGE